MSNQATIEQALADFVLARNLMTRVENFPRTGYEPTIEDLDAIEYSLVECVATFSRWVNTRRKEVS